MNSMIEVRNLSKNFVLHNQGGACIHVFEKLSLNVHAGECVALHGQSGAGKSTLLRSLYANYKPCTGDILVRHGQEKVNLVTATPRKIIELRQHSLGYVSQFLRVIPRVSAIDVVSTPRRELFGNAEETRAKAAELLTRLNIPQRLWDIAPATFSGGEQQRVNIARGFSVEYPILLLDEPTASLDAKNSAVVIKLIQEAKARGTAIVGIFHDDDAREAVADRTFNMSSLEQQAA